MTKFPFTLESINIHPLNIEKGIEYLIETRNSANKETTFTFTRFHKVWYGWTCACGWSQQQMHYEWEKGEKNPSYYSGSYDETMNLRIFKNIWKIKRVNYEKQLSIENPLLNKEDVEII